LRAVLTASDDNQSRVKAGAQSGVLFDDYILAPLITSVEVGTVAFRPIVKEGDQRRQPRRSRSPPTLKSLHALAVSLRRIDADQQANRFGTREMRDAIDRSTGSWP
jgi:hypothetical protein